MGNAVENKVMEIAAPLAEEMGYYLVAAEYKKEAGDRFLRLYIDKTGGVGIDDCERFSRAVEVKIDEADPIAENYCLEVSSPGADRTLKTAREFEYYTGREVEVKLYSAIDSKKEFEGTLSGFGGGTAFVETDGKTLEIPVKQAVYIRLAFKF